MSPRLPKPVRELGAANLVGFVESWAETRLRRPQAIESLDAESSTREGPGLRGVGTGRGLSSCVGR